MDRRNWPCWALVAVLAIVLLGTWRSLGAAKAETERLRGQVAALEAKVAQLEEQLEACGEPLPGPIIDITPNPNGGGNHFTIGGAPAISTPAQGDTLNKIAFGKVMRFKAIFEVDGTTVVRELAGFKAKFGGKLLELDRVGSNPENLRWVFDGQELSPWTSPPSQRHWRDDLCAPMTDLQFTFKVPDELTGTFVKIEVQADVAQQ